MLWLKAWRESRVRFGLGALILAGICLGVIGFHRDAAGGLGTEWRGYPAFVWEVVYRGYLRDLFELTALLLGLGGLLAEQTAGTAEFTLALPVGRHRLLVHRTLVGLVEVAALGFIPAILLPTVSPLAGQLYPWETAWKFGVLWTAGGSLLFALGVLASAVLAGESAAPIGALFLLLGYSGLAELPGLDRWLVNVHDLMSGRRMPFFDAATFSIARPLPWTSIGMTAALAAAAVALASGLTARRDF
jgi:hypothetical protein